MDNTNAFKVEISFETKKGLKSQGYYFVNENLAKFVCKEISEHYSKNDSSSVQILGTYLLSEEIEDLRKGRRLFDNFEDFLSTYCQNPKNSEELFETLPEWIARECEYV